MPNPTSKYQVHYDGNLLPGYVQNEELPIQSRDSRVDILNSDGGNLLDNGAQFRAVSLQFDILSRLGNNSTGLAHLGDCLEQYREAARYVTRVPSASTLFLGNTSHYLVAKYAKMTVPLAAPDSRRIRYSIDWVAKPWFFGPTVQDSQTISGDTTVTLNMPDTRKTYPSFRIAAGVSRVTVSHTPSGKSFTFSGSHAVAITVDCANLTVKNTTDENRVDYLITGPDFGIYHIGSGSCSFAITDVVGSGNLLTKMTPRLER